MGKLISVIIPCYNVEPYIDRCMTSLINQTIGIENMELICIDDASNDRTWDKLLEWEKQYPESVILIQNSHNLKQGGARNRGLQYASAPYNGFVDSDDWVDPTMYEKLYEKTVEYDCDMVRCLFNRAFDETVSLRRLHEDTYFEISSVEDRKRLIAKDMMDNIVCTKLYKRELMDSHGVQFPEGFFYEDNYWSSLMFLYVKSVYFLNEELYHYFVNYDSTLLKRNDIKKLDRLKIELMKIEEYHKRGVYQIYQQEIEKNFIIMYFINTCHTLFCTWDDFSIDLFRMIKRQVIRLFPKYKENAYIKALPDIQKIILNLLERDVSQEDLYVFKEEYIKLLIKMNQE